MDAVIHQVIKGIGGEVRDILRVDVRADQRLILPEDAPFDAPAHPKRGKPPIQAETKVVQIRHLAEQHALNRVLPDKGNRMFEALVVGAPVPGGQKNLSRLWEQVAGH